MTVSESSCDRFSFNQRIYLGVSLVIRKKKSLIRHKYPVPHGLPDQGGCGEREDLGDGTSLEAGDLSCL